MAEETTQHRTIRYLQDAHAAQTGIAEALEAYASDTDDAGLKTLFQSQLTQVRSQSQRIEARINALGGDTNGGKGFLNTIAAKASGLMSAGHDDFDKNTQNVIKAYTAAHGNRGLFESLIAWSSAIGDHESLNLGQQLQQENVAAAEQIFPHIARYAQTALANTVGTSVASATGGTYVS